MPRPVRDKPYYFHYGHMRAGTLPVSEMKIRFPGQLSNFTGKIIGHKVVNGETTLTGSEQDIKGIFTYMKKCWQVEEVPNGELQDDAIAGPAESTVPDGDGAVSEVESGLPEVERIPVQGTSVLREGDAGDEAGDQGIPPSGDGQGRPETAAEKLRAALAKLDSNNDDHWTALGLPRISTVNAIYGLGEFNRADINKLAPDLMRENARTHT